MIITSVCLILTFIFSPSPVSSNTVPLGLPAHPEGPPAIKPKQNIQQFQIAVVLPPGAQKPTNGPQPPSSGSPDYVWVQLPASYFTQAPPVAQPLPVEPLPIQPGVMRPPSPANPPNVPAVPSPPTTSAPVGNLLKKCLTPRGQFQSDVCNKYVNCWDGVAVEQFCPEGTAFNAAKGYCDYPANVDCGGRPIQGIPPPTPSNATTAVPGQTSSEAPTTASPPTVIVSLPTIDPSLRKRCLKPRGQFRSESCNKYVNCWDDVVIEQECPEGLLFSNKGYCDYPHNVDCQNSSAPPRSGDLVSSECPLDFGTFRNKDDCRNYYTCIGGKIVANYSCPVGFNFNDNIGVCDYADRVDCTKEPFVYNPRSNFLSNVPKDFMEKIDNCEPGSMFALNPQCTAACLCHDGLSEVVQCPVGLAYDSHADKCLLPHLAKC
ncbi:unnamed protein product [Tenebrio molitor]|nr:unnamed protein product [Tenebrio molitor]